MDIAALGIKIDSSGAVKATSDLDSFTSAASKAEKAASGIGSGASSAAKSFDEMDRATQRSAASTATLALNLSRFGAILGSALSVREVIKAADSWTGLENRLRLVTTSAEQLAKATGDVYKIAQDTSSGLDATAQVYQRFAQNADVLGISLGKVATLTDTVSKAVAISGSSAASAEAALMQFGQALASGVFRGEEFNSVNEQANGLIQALANGLGVTTGRLKELAAEGKLTGDVLVQALTNASGFIDEKFNTRVKTVEQSVTELGNAFTKYAGELDKTLGASSAVADVISTVAKNFDIAAAAVGTIIAARLVPWLVTVGSAAVSSAASITSATSAVVALRTATLSLVGGPLGAIVTALGLGATAWFAFGKSAQDSLDIASRGVLATNDGLADMVKKFGELNAVQQQLTIGERQNDLANATREASQALDDLISKVAVVEGARAAPRIREAFSEQLRGIVDDAQLTNMQVASSLMDLVNKFTDGTRVNSEYRKSLLEQVQAYINARSAAGEYSAQLDALKKSLEDAKAGINGVTIDLNDQAAKLSEFMKSYATNSEKMTAEIKKWDEALGGLTSEQRQRIIDRFTEKTAKKAKTLTEAQKAQQAFEQTRQSSIQAQYEEISSLDQQAQALEKQAAYIGYSEQALNALTIAEIENQKAALASFDGAEEQIEILERQIDAYKRMGAAIGDKSVKEQQRAEWQQWSNEVGQIFDQVGQKLTDAIFDGGKSGRELVKDLFKTLTLRVLVQPVMGALQGAATNILGGALGIGSGESGGLSGLLSGANSLSSLYGAFTGGVTSTLASGISALGSAFGSSALTSFATGMKGATLGAGLAGPTTLGAGGAMGAGAAVAAALPWVTGGLAVASLAQKAFGLGGKEKTGEGFAGWIKGSRGGQDVLTYETASRSGGWLRSGANYLDFRAGDPSVQAGISDLVAQTSSSLKAYADALALNTQDIQEYAKHIFVPTMDKSAQEIQERILSEVNLYAQELTRDFWPALQDVRRGGEELTDTLARIAGSIQAVNPVLEMLNLKTFDLSIQGGELASKFTDLFGGIEGFAGATGAYYDAFFTEQEKFENGLQSMSARLGEIGVVLPDLSQSTDDVRKQYRAMIEAQDLSTEIGQRNAAILIQNSTAVLGLSEAATSLAEAAKAADESVQDMTAILNERAGLERQIMQLMGDTEGLRRLDLAALDESNQALQQRIWALNDESEALSKAAANQQAAMALRNQADSLLGNIEAIREREIDGMDESVAAWQRYVWAIEDEQKRQAKAVEQYRIDLAEWQRLQDAVGEAFRELQRIATSEIEKLRDAARQTDAAMATLTKRVQAQSDLINKQVSGLETLLGAMRSVFDYIGAQVRDLRGVSGSRGMYAQQGRDFIAQALSGGGVPDLGKLTEAVTSIRDEMAATEYGSSFERDYAANVLANQLEALQDSTEPQISLAEQQLKLAQDQLKQLEEMVKNAQEAIDETRGVKDNTGDLKVSWDAYTDALATTLDQSASFNAVVSAIESGIMLSQAAWAEQLNKWDSSLGSAQKQYDALKALVDAGLVTDAGTQAQIDALGLLLAEAQKQVGVLEGVDTNTGASGTAGEQVKKLKDLFDEATKQIDALSGVESTTSWTKDLYDKVLSAATYERWATKEIEGINKQLDLAQKQLDAFNGVNSKATTMIQALNNMAAALKAAQVKQPTNPGTGGGSQVQLPPKPQVPSVVTTAAHGFTDAEVRGKRYYSPVTEAEAYDYIFNQEKGLQDAWNRAWQSGAYYNTPQSMLYWARNHWREYGQFDGGGTRRYATGGNHSGGLRLVGEFGPELEATGPSRVYNHMKTQDILRNAFTGNGTMGPEMATLTRHAEQMIRTIETMGRATVFQLQRIARQLERWDTDGMPETRDMVAA